jgi:hypothetical protein
MELIWGFNQAYMQKTPGSSPGTKILAMMNQAGYVSVYDPQ